MHSVGVEICIKEIECERIERKKAERFGCERDRRRNRDDETNTDRNLKEDGK